MRLLHTFLPLVLLVCPIVVNAINVGGDGTSERDAFVYYLIGDQETYPNLKLSLWNEEVRFNKTYYGEVRLHGELALRVNDWIDYEDETAKPIDDKLIEMGWSFTNSTDEKSPKYDGMKAQFVFNSTQVNSADLPAYSRTFELVDLYSKRLDREDKEPISLKVDKNLTNWEIVPHKSKKVCSQLGQCAFIVGFVRSFETTDPNGQDFKIDPTLDLEYDSYGFYAEYLKPLTNLESNLVDQRRYAISDKDIKVKLTAEGPLLEVVYPKEQETEGISLGLITLGATVKATVSVVACVAGLAALTII